MIPMSENGGFPNWLRELQLAFHVNHAETDALIAILRIVPHGYECDESQEVYGVYVDVSLEREHDPRISPFGDFIDTQSFRDLEFLLSAPSPDQEGVRLSGEAFSAEFVWHKDGRLRIEARFGISHWSDEYLNDMFKKCPFLSDVRIKCFVTNESLNDTRKAVNKLLKIVDEVESGKIPNQTQT